MAAVRDVQRSRVYLAERMAFSKVWGRVDFENVEQIAPWLRRLESHRWWAEHFCRVNGLRVVEHWARERAVVRASNGLIVLPRGERSKHRVLHEVAHCLHYWVAARREAEHGPRFCAIYLHLVRCAMDREFGVRLEKAFRRQAVEVGDIWDNNERGATWTSNG